LAHLTICATKKKKKKKKKKVNEKALWQASGTGAGAGRTGDFVSKYYALRGWGK
jgi:hypothetical protein